MCGHVKLMHLVKRDSPVRCCQESVIDDQVFETRLLSESEDAEFGFCMTLRVLMLFLLGWRTVIISSEKSGDDRRGLSSMRGHRVSFQISDFGAVQSAPSGVFPLLGTQSLVRPDGTSILSCDSASSASSGP
jgi:hypothetical protein